MLPQAAHPRQVVLELRELDLELALGRPRMLREDVEDQLSPVDDAKLQGVLEASLLARIEIAVDDQRLGRAVGDAGPELVEAPLAEIGPRVGRTTALGQLADDARPPRRAPARGPRQLLLLVHVGREHRDEECSLRLRARGRIRLVLAHGGDYARFPG